MSERAVPRCRTSSRLATRRLRMKTKVRVFLTHNFMHVFQLTRHIFNGSVISRIQNLFLCFLNVGIKLAERFVLKFQALTRYLHKVIRPRNFFNSASILNKKLRLQIVQKGKAQLSRKLSISQAEIAYPLGL